MKGRAAVLRIYRSNNAWFVIRPSFIFKKAQFLKYDYMYEQTKSTQVPLLLGHDDKPIIIIFFYWNLKCRNKGLKGDRPKS